MKLKAGKWLLHTPIAALPLLAAWALNGAAVQKDLESRAISEIFSFAGAIHVLQQNWLWISLALALGIWTGWKTAGTPESK